MVVFSLNTISKFKIYEFRLTVHYSLFNQQITKDVNIEFQTNWWNWVFLIMIIIGSVEVWNATQMRENRQKQQCVDDIKTFGNHSIGKPHADNEMNEISFYGCIPTPLAQNHLHR